MPKVRLTRRQRIRDRMDGQIRVMMESQYGSVKGFCRAAGMDEKGYQAFRKRMKSSKGLCLDDLITVILKTGWHEEEFR